MHGQNQGLCGPSRTVVRATLLIVVVLLAGFPLASGQVVDGPVVAEVFVSPNSAAYGGVDYNGDGEISRDSDQFIELHNPSATSIDLTGWQLDDLRSGGSAPCSIASGTTIPPDGRLAFFRPDTGIELDYWEGDTVHLIDPQGTIVDAFTYPESDSEYGKAYIRTSEGALSKVDPSPGTAPGMNGTAVQARCDVILDDDIAPYILTGRIVPMTSESDVIDHGSMLIRDGQIAAIWTDLPPAGVNLEGIPVHATSGTIFPGLIDSHNHPHYNAIPLWDHGTAGWDNRYQWRTESFYSPAITQVENGLNDGGSVGCDLMVESMKFAEVRSIAGGTTTIQGASDQDAEAFESILARNLERNNFGGDGILTRVGGSWFPSDYSGSHVKSGNSSGSLNAWIIHLAEGIDEPSRAEFDVLLTNDLLMDELMIIHGTALTATEFRHMANAGASLVWSPMSNLVLYGDTADVIAADEAGVRISIAPDWAPSGAKNVLGEVKVADWWNRNVLSGHFSDYELVQMISTNPVDEVGWTSHVGRLVPGMAADLLVVDTFDVDPYRNLIEAVDPDVRLVVVDGRPIMGDVGLMTDLIGADEAEVVTAPGYQKAVDITRNGVPEGSQTFSSVLGELTSCMEGMSSSAAPKPLETWYTYGDERYFDVLNRSIPFQSGGRSIDLYGDYYAVEMDAAGDRTGVTLPSNLTSPETTVDGDDLVALAPTGGTLHPRLLSDATSIPMEACMDAPNASEPGPDMIVACGALLILTGDPEVCMVEIWNHSDGTPIENGPWLSTPDVCPENPEWTVEHWGVSEEPRIAGQPLVSRLDPGHRIGTTIGMPGRTCDHATVTALEGPGGAIDASSHPILSNWTCVDRIEIMAAPTCLDGCELIEVARGDVVENGTLLFTTAGLLGVLSLVALMTLERRRNARGVPELPPMLPPERVLGFDTLRDWGESEE